MSTSHWIATIFELLLIVLIILGFLYEPVIAKWERKQGKKMLRAFKERKRYRR